MLDRLREVVRRSAGLLRWAAAGALLLAVVLLALALPANALEKWLKAEADALGVWGPVLLALLYVLLTFVLVPSTPVSLAAGAAFGTAVGAVVNSVASTVSAALCFLLARYAARGPVARWVAGRPRLRAVYEAVAGPDGWKVVAAVRASHAAPFGLQNYFFGVSPIRFWPYLVSTWVVMLPGAVFYAYVGAVGAAALAEVRGAAPTDPWVWAVRGAALLAAAAALLYIGHVVRRALKKATNIDVAAAAREAAPAAKGWPWGTLAALLLAVAALAAACWAFAEREQVRRLLEGWPS
jgi:uncharacterized membrane protein YdjX (TVP38/TMEM64 family)